MGLLDRFTKTSFEVPVGEFSPTIYIYDKRPLPWFMNDGDQLQLEVIKKRTDLGVVTVRSVCLYKGKFVGSSDAVYDALKPLLRRFDQVFFTATYHGMAEEGYPIIEATTLYEKQVKELVKSLD